VLCAAWTRHRNALMLATVLALLALTGSPAAAEEGGSEGLVPNVSNINIVWYIAPIGAIVALIFAMKFYREVKSANPGDEKMIEIGDFLGL